MVLLFITLDNRDRHLEKINGPEKSRASETVTRASETIIGVSEIVLGASEREIVAGRKIRSSSLLVLFPSRSLLLSSRFLT